MGSQEGDSNSQWYGRVALILLAQFGRPSSYLDVGCGDGIMVQAMRDARVRPSIGIATTREEREAGQCPNHVLVRDVSRTFRLSDTYELVTAIRTLPVDNTRLWSVAATLSQHCEYRLVVEHGHLENFLKQEGLRFDQEASDRLNQALNTLGECPTSAPPPFYCYIRPSFRIAVRE